MKIVIVKSTRYDMIEKHQSSLLFIPSRIQFYSAICPVVSSIKAFTGSQNFLGSVQPFKKIMFDKNLDQSSTGTGSDT